jgi:hypothetical protein
VTKSVEKRKSQTLVRGRVITQTTGTQTTGRTTLAKGRSSRNREAKKPKADKTPTLAGSTFLRPQPQGKAPPSKDGAKPE